jgi:signal transduction histidine kinase
VALRTGPSTSRPPEPPVGGLGATDRPLAEQLLRRILSDIRAGGLGRHVRLELACQPGLEVRQDSLRFQNTVAALVRHAAAQAPSGRVLVTCAHQAGRLRVAVADDGVGAESAAQEAALRATAEELALQGGALEITSRADEGSTIVAYWPDVRDARPQANRPEVTAAPSNPDVPQVQSLIHQSG